MSEEATLREIRDSVSDLSVTMASFLSVQAVLNESQKVINESNTNTLNKISDSMRNSEAMQVEMNGQTQRLTELSQVVKENEKQTAVHTTQLAVTKTVVESHNEVKVMFTRAFIALGIAFTIAIGSQVFLTQGNNEVQQAILKIAQGIK